MIVSLCLSHLKQNLTQAELDKMLQIDQSQLLVPFSKNLRKEMVKSTMEERLEQRKVLQEQL